MFTSNRRRTVSIVALEDGLHPSRIQAPQAWERSVASRFVMMLRVLDET
jgi:hypothetical protein